MYHIASILLLILLLVAGSFSTIYFPKNTPIKHHDDHHQDHGDQHKVLKRISVADVHTRNIFAGLDKNNDEFITKHEVIESLKNIGIVMSERGVDDVVWRLDANRDGMIDLDEFCNSMEGPLMATEAGFKDIFYVFDVDEDGFITVKELVGVLSGLGLKEGNKMEDCEKIIRQVDLDGDGAINFLDFKNMMIKSGNKLVPFA